MIYVMTSDSYFFLGIRALTGNDNSLRVTDMALLPDGDTSEDILVVDTLRTGSLTPEALNQPGRLTMRRIVFFSVLKVSGQSFLSPVYFVARNTGLPETRRLLAQNTPGTFRPLPVFSVRQLEVARLYLADTKRKHAQETLNVSGKTLDAHKYRLMLLKIRRICHIVNLPVAGHLAERGPVLPQMAGAVVNGPPGDWPDDDQEAPCVQRPGY